MRKSLLLLFVLLFSIGKMQSQTLLNALEIDLTSVSIDGNTVASDATEGRMMIPFNKTRIKLFQNDDFSYWAEFKYKECGKKAKLSSETFVELNDGKVIKGSKSNLQHPIGENEPAWFVAVTNDTININDKSTFIAGFDYEMRISN